MTTANRQRRGFTLVELLVVIAIIGTLVALLLPAVQYAREVARRTACGNNIRQIALACISYENTLGSYPPGYFFPKDIAGGNDQFEQWGWGALILPYLEQKGLYDAIGVQKPGALGQRIASPDGVVVARGIQSVLKVYMCPTDTGFEGRGQVPLNRRFDAGWGISSASAALLDAGISEPGLVGVSNYMGVAGHRRSFSDLSAPLNGQNTGIFYENSKVRDGDIQDGTSNTWLIGERNSLDCMSGTWVGVCKPTASGPTGTVVNGPYSVLGYARPVLNVPVFKAGIPPQQQLKTAPWESCKGCGEGFSSLHASGSQFALCDGSVRFVANTIGHTWYPEAPSNPVWDPGVCSVIARPGDEKKVVNGVQQNGLYQKLMSRADKQAVGPY